MKKKCFFLLLGFLTGMFIELSAQTCNCTPPSGYSQCYQVIRTDDVDTCGTLRYAINQANSNTGGTYIKFNLAPNLAGRAVIQLTSNLPGISKKVMIDGTSNPGAVPVVIRGNKSTTNVCFSMADNGVSGSTIKGLVITGFVGRGIQINGLNTAISDISIINNRIYDIINLSTPAGNLVHVAECLIISNAVSNVYIYGNTFSGYKDVSNVMVRDTDTDARCRSIWMETGAVGKAITNVLIGSGADIDKNYFYCADLCVYARVVSCSYGAITKVSVKNNFFDAKRNGLSFVHYGTTSTTCHFNNNKQKPVVTKFDPVTNAFVGTSSPGDRIELYTDYPETTPGWTQSYPNGRNSASALVYLGYTTANASGNWSIPKSSWTNPNLPVNDYDVFSVIADSAGNSSDFVPYVHVACTTILDIVAPSIVCKNIPSTITITGKPAGGTFSCSPAPPTLTGTTTTNVNSSAFTASGVYTVTYTIPSTPILSSRQCPLSTSRKILVPAPADTLTRVINVTAGTLNDAWPLDGAALSPTVGFGTSGIKYMWAPEEQYAYVDNRDQRNTLQTRTDGLLYGVPMFNWKNMASNACYANWRKVNTITQINSGTGQLENKDILNNYSAALYGYNDQLTTAVAANASYKEIAFDSFEEYALGSSNLNLDTLPKSNLTVVTSDPSANLNQEINFTFEITEGVDNMILINFPYALSQLLNKRVGVFGASVENFGVKNIQGYYDIQSVVPGIAAGTAKIILADFSFTGFWKGKLAVPFKINDPAMPAKFTIPSGANSIVNVFPVPVQRKAHSGKQFLKVTASAEMEQVSMRLTPSRKYVIGAWVSTDEPDADTYVAGTTGTDRRIEISFIDAFGAVIAPALPADYMFVPSGLIIEGWQRLEGVVTVPANAVRFTLKFVTPATTYFDDVRIFPFDGNMQSYVYNKTNYKLQSVLDQNNYASYYYYNEEGSLYLVKKETETGVQTLQEVYSHSTEYNK